MYHHKNRVTPILFGELYSLYHPTSLYLYNITSLHLYQLTYSIHSIYSCIVGALCLCRFVYYVTTTQTCSKSNKAIRITVAINSDQCIPWLYPTVAIISDRLLVVHELPNLHPTSHTLPPHTIVTHLHHPSLSFFILVPADNMDDCYSDIR